MAHILVSAAHKSSGKTTVTAGLCAALQLRGLSVQPFKKGPDYIDPMWLSLAAGRNCHNLDFYTMKEQEILAVFSRHAQDAEVSVIEGNKGLYDGLDLEGGNSNAALATLLGAPVVLVIDARGMTRGIAPLILGYQAFDKRVNIAGIILNKIGGSRHEAKLRAIIEHYTDIAVLGAVHFDEKLVIAERHLGLVPSNEAAAARDKMDSLADALEAQVDIDHLLAIAGMAKGPEAMPAPRPTSARPDMRVGIARDSAFGFYYPGDLEALETAGARLVPVNMLQDTNLPDVDALLIGGGFPETHMAALEANISLRTQVQAAIQGGLPAYAECGGLMYLARSMTWKGRRFEMAGAIPGDIVMHDKPQGRGYVQLRETGSSPWPHPEGASETLPAHEFHYSSLENLEGEPIFAYEMLRGAGVDGRHDGLVIGNLLANYAHLRDVEGNRWARRFVAFARECKSPRSAVQTG